MIKKEILRRAIDGLELSGKEICVHSSMKSFGEAVEGGAEGLVDLFLEAGCTLLVPTFSYSCAAPPIPGAMPEQNGAGDYSYFLDRDYPEQPVFSQNSKEISTEDMGVFPTVVLNRRDSVRGNHPLNSFTAVGKHAERLASAQDPRNVYGPLAELCRGGGKVLLIGVSLCCATILHYGEQLAGRTPFVRWARTEHGSIPVFAGSCSEGFERLAPLLRPLEKTQLVGQSLWTCYDAREMAELSAVEIRKNPQITQCSDPCCDRCRDALLGGPILPADFWEKF